jgi:phage terminase small subunit
MTVPSFTHKQQKFIDLYVETRDYFEAYLQAYEPKRMRPSAIQIEGWKTLQKPNIAKEVNRRLGVLAEKVDESTGFNAIHALSLFLDLVRADPNELIGLRVGACRKCWGDGHHYQWRTEDEYCEAVEAAEKAKKSLPLPDGGFGYDHTREPCPDCPYCGGEGESRIVPQDTRKLSPGGKILFQGVKQTKDGLQIILADRTKALENAAKIIGAFTDKIEIHGSVTNLKPDMKGMSGSDAARAYADFIKGIDAGGKKL